MRGDEVRCRVRCVNRKLFICVALDVDYKCRVQKVVSSLVFLFVNVGTW